jgi:hypothetical protein
MSAALEFTDSGFFLKLRRVDFGAPTSVVIAEAIPYYVNAFWTSAQRRANPLHEISYRACFKPQLPAFFIDRLTQPGDAVCDPFMGRGTSILQAALMGRKPIGSDANPLSQLLTRPRLSPPSLGEIEARLAAAPWGRGEIERDDLLAFFHVETLRQICALRRYLLGREKDGGLDAVDDWIRMVALNRLTGHSSGFFSVYTMPPNQAVSVKAQLRINARRAQTPPRRDIAELIYKKSRALLAQGAPLACDARLAVADAASLTHIADATVDLVVTSPPFLDVVDYRGDSWLRNWFAGIDGVRISLSQHRSPHDWSAMTRTVFEELARVLKPGGHVAYEVGEVRGGALPLEQLVWRALDDLPFERLGVLVNAQSFTKTSHCWGVANNVKGVNSNRVIVVRRL